MGVFNEYESSGKDSRHVIRDKFEQLPQLGGGYEAGVDDRLLAFSGFSGFDGLCARSAQGGVTCTASGFSGWGGGLFPHSTAGRSQFGVSGYADTSALCRYEATVTTGSDITEQVIWAGLKMTHTAAIATDNNQSFFRYQHSYETGQENWFLVTSRDGTDESFDTGIPVVASTTYKLVIELDSARNVWAYIDDKMIGLGPRSPVEADVALYPSQGVQSERHTGTDPHSIVVHYVEVGRQI